MDNFTLFHFGFVANNPNGDEHFWSHSVDTNRHSVWAGLAFERTCLWHLPQMLNALGISGIISSAHSWLTKSTEDHPGVQIDMLIDRNDNVINLCEMKFCDSDYTLDKDEDAKLRTRKAVFKAVTRTRKTVHQTLVTTYGLIRNAYSGNIQSVITMDDLFRP